MVDITGAEYCSVRLCMLGVWKLQCFYRNYSTLKVRLLVVLKYRPVTFKWRLGVARYACKDAIKCQEVSSDDEGTL